MIIIIIPVVLQYGVGVWWGVAVPDLPRDGVSIKHCWLCTLKFTSNQNMSVMSNQSFSLTGVKEAGTNSGEVGPVVMVLLRKEVRGGNGLKKLIEL